MMRGRIIGSGHYLPEHVMTNNDLLQYVDTSDEWIQERTGIQQRHIASPEQKTVDLAVNAAQVALADANIEAEDIDLIIVATTTSDDVFPSMACGLQQRLGIHNVPAFDVQAVCSGFIYALDIANKFIQTGSAKNVLIVGAEVLSRILDWSDRSTCILFGDGAGAMVLQASSSAGVLASRLSADGEYLPMLKTEYRQGKKMDGQQCLGHFISMQGAEVFKLAVNKLIEVSNQVLSESGYGHEDIDWLVSHQANIRIINATAKRLALPTEKIILTIGQHGNTSAASIPLAFDVAVKTGRIKRGDKVLFTGMGGGFAWGACLVEY